VEFAFDALGMNSHWGTPVNPWEPVHHRAPGGSRVDQARALLARGGIWARPKHASANHHSVQGANMKKTNRPLETRRTLPEVRFHD